MTTTSDPGLVETPERRRGTAIPGAYTVRDGVHYERLIVFEAIVPANR